MTYLRWILGYPALTSAMLYLPGPRSLLLTLCSVLWTRQHVSSVKQESLTMAWLKSCMIIYTGSMWQIEWRTNSVSSYTDVSMASLRSRPYLVDCCTPVTDIVGRQRLRSATQQLMVVPRHRLTTVGRRAFAVHGPMVWNSLPDDLRAQQDYESFRQRLKTWLFSRY